MKNHPPIHYRLYISRRGQTLVEAVAAIALTIIVTTSLVGLGVGAIRSATVARNRSKATAYAQEAIEALRSIRDRSYAELASCGSGSYRIIWSSSQWSCQSGTEDLDPFTRSFAVINLDSGKRLRVAVTVGWRDIAGDHNIVLYAYFTNWR